MENDKCTHSRKDTILDRHYQYDIGKGNYSLAKPSGSFISDITPGVPGSWYTQPKAECLTQHSL